MISDLFIDTDGKIIPPGTLIRHFETDFYNGVPNWLTPVSSTTVIASKAGITGGVTLTDSIDAEMRLNCPAVDLSNIELRAIRMTFHVNGVDNAVNRMRIGVLGASGANGVYFDQSASARVYKNIGGTLTSVATNYTALGKNKRFRVTVWIFPRANRLYFGDGEDIEAVVDITGLNLGTMTPFISWLRQSTATETTQSQDIYNCSIDYYIL